jgi:hypothetical protein
MRGGNLSYTLAMEYYSSIKKNELLVSNRPPKHAK